MQRSDFGKQNRLPYIRIMDGNELLKGIDAGWVVITEWLGIEDGRDEKRPIGGGSVCTRTATSSARISPLSVTAANGNVV